MKKNMAVGDRFLRLVAAVVLLVLYFTSNIAAPFHYLLLLFAGIFGVTAILGSCPLYTLFRIDTRQFKS